MSKADFLNWITEYYRDTEDQYRRVWDLDHSMALHFGYWDRETKNNRDALQNMNRIVARIANIKNQDTVVDLGCGVGGTAIFLSKIIGCKVAGCSISERQVELTRQNVKIAGVWDLVSLCKCNYLHTPYAASSFNVALAIESACHAPDKREFLGEAYRILKSGGRIVLTDFMVVKQSKTQRDKEYLKRLSEGWAVPAFANLRDFTEEMRRVGFQNVIIRDATRNIFYSSRRLYRLLLVSYVARRLFGFWNKLSEVEKANFFTGFYQYQVQKRGICKYFIVSGEKRP